MIDKLLEKFNLKFEDLTPEERQTLYTWVDVLEKGQLTVEKVRENISSMKYAVENALIDEPEFAYIFIFKVPNRKQILLKARLKNYILIEAMLSTPERARAELEKVLSGIAPK